MAIVNGALGKLFEILMLPFRALPPWVALVVVSVLFALAMLLVYKRTSDQKRIASTKRKIHAALFEMRLLSDEPTAIFRALLDVLRHNGVYVALSLVPLLWMIVPLGLTLVHLHGWFGYEPLMPGQQTYVTARLAEDWRADLAGVDEGARPPISLQAGDGVDVITPAVWLPSKNEVRWKLAAREAGAHELKVVLGDETYDKSLRVGGGFVRRSAVRPAGAFLDQVEHPSEPPLPKGPLKAIEVKYADAGTPFLDLPMWMWQLFVVSIVVAFALKGPLGVEI